MSYYIGEGKKKHRQHIRRILYLVSWMLAMLVAMYFCLMQPALDDPLVLWFKLGGDAMMLTLVCILISIRWENMRL